MPHGELELLKSDVADLVESVRGFVWLLIKLVRPLSRSIEPLGKLIVSLSRSIGRISKFVRPLS